MDQGTEDQIEGWLCLMLYRAQHAMTSAYRRVLDPFGLTYPQYLVLCALARSESAPIKDLAALMGSDYGTVSPLIKRLEARGLVVRARGEDDERQVQVRLTAQGRHLQHQTRGVQAEIRAATGLDTPQRDHLVDELRHLATRLQEYGRSAAPLQAGPGDGR